MFLTGLRESLERLSLTFISPSSVIAIFALVLAILILFTNHRRSINRAWVTALLLIALWQGGVASIFWLHQPILHRAGIFFGGLFICSLGFLKETIVAPRASIKSRLKLIRFHLALATVFIGVFSNSYISYTEIDGMYARHSWYWIVNLNIVILGIYLIVDSAILLKRNKLTGIIRNDVIAFLILVSFALGTVITSIVLGSVLKIRYAQ